MNKEIKNSIWPNGIQVDENGYAIFCPMGTNKVDIPKNSPHWPKGSKLVGSFVYDKDDKLVGFCDTKAMTSEGGLVIMPYEEIDTSFDSIEKNSIQIHAPKASHKKASWNGGGEKEDIPDVDYKYKGCKNVSEIKTVDGNYMEDDVVDGCWTELLSDVENSEKMFYSKHEITSFKSDLSSLTNGTYTFGYCDNLTIFIADMSSLTVGNQMFYKCQNLSTFNCSDLNFLNTAVGMFQACSNLLCFNSDLKSLNDAEHMFYNCVNLTHFESDLKSLTNGNYTFGVCSKLTSFKSDLSSLTNGYGMFYYCKLDVPSIKNIINTINTVETANLTLGMGCNNNQTDKDFFAQEVGYPDMSTLLTALQNKGWTVTAQYNGRPSSTFSLRKPESLPVFVKLIEVIPTDEDSFYEYTSQDGSKFYNLDWFHETTGSTDGYTQFNSLEEAITHFKLLNKA